MSIYACCCFSRVQLCVTLWIVSLQAPLSMGILQERTLEWVVMPSSRGSSQPKIELVSLMSPALAGMVFATRVTWETLICLYTTFNILILRQKSAIYKRTFTAQVV